VVLQSLLLVLMPLSVLAGPGWPTSVERTLDLVGAAAAVAGAAVVALAFRRLGRSLTPFPRPVEAGALVETGPYRYVRHPVYAGLLLLCAGVALAYSPLAFVPTAALAIVWGLKARLEERLLSSRYPAYGEYMGRTRFRLVPFVY